MSETTKLTEEQIVESVFKDYQDILYADVEDIVHEALLLAREREWISVDKNNPPQGNGLWAQSVWSSTTKEFKYWDVGFGGYDDEDGRILNTDGDQISDMTLDTVEYFLPITLPNPPTQ